MNSRGVSFMGWLDEMTPNEYVASFTDIDLDKLWAQGRRLILCDLDNTLVPWNDPAASNQLVNWLEQVHQLGFAVCIVSNNHGPRVEAFAKVTDLAFVAAARKPRPEAFVDAMAQFQCLPDETVMVGDQLFTDIRGGNRAGVYTILVVPIHPREWWGTRMVRQAERLVMRRLQRRGLKSPV